VIEIGVFARTFPAGTAKQVAAAIREPGFTVTHLNLSVLGRPTLDAALTRQGAHAIASDFHAVGVRIWSLSGTFNAIHPDAALRRASAEACVALIARAPHFSAEVVTLCTGTRDPEDTWRAHPDNTSQEAWSDLRRTLDLLIPAARAAGIRLGVEPELGNVVRDAHTAARLIDELGPDAAQIGIVLDPANLLSVDTLADQKRILTEAFDLLGQHTVAVHAKDVVASGYCAPGAGGMDYDLVMRLHHTATPNVPVIAQDLTADDAQRVYDHLVRHAQHAADVA
jgi:sugar phosphate isomerase/epimerase